MKIFVALKVRHFVQFLLSLDNFVRKYIQRNAYASIGKLMFFELLTIFKWIYI